MNRHLNLVEGPELVLEVKQYQLEIHGLDFKHSLGSGTQLLERDSSTLQWLQGELRAGVGVIVSPRLSRFMLDLNQIDKKVA